MISFHYLSMIRGYDEKSFVVHEGNDFWEKKVVLLEFESHCWMLLLEGVAYVVNSKKVDEEKVSRGVGLVEIFGVIYFW